MRMDLSAAELEAAEQQAAELADVPEALRPAAEEPVTITFADAVQRLRRIRWHRQRMAETIERAAALMAPLEAEMRRLRDWLIAESAKREVSIAVHEAALAAYYRQNPPERGKTLVLPGGKISYRAQRPELVRDDDALMAWVQAFRPDLLRVRQDVDLVALRAKLSAADDGSVYLTDTGEAVPGVRLAAKPDVIKVEVDAG